MGMIARAEGIEQGLERGRAEGIEQGLECGKLFAFLDKTYYVSIDLFNYSFSIYEYFNFSNKKRIRYENEKSN